jgi:hypothetical protein
MSGSSSALLQAARLREKTSAKGTRYMQGRLGGAQFFQDGSSTQPRQAERAPPAGSRERPRQASPGGPIEDDPLPF